VVPVLFAVAVVSTGTGFWTISLSDPEADGELTLAAEIVIGFVLGMVAGGMYRPLLLTVPFVESPPVTPFTCQVTVLLEELATLA
jgi:hypothetical protein